MSETYKVLDDFQAGDTNIRVLELDRDYDFPLTVEKCIAVIAGKKYPFKSNSVRRWITIESRDDFKGKTVELI